MERRNGRIANTREPIELQRIWAMKAIPIIVRLVAAIGGGYAVSAGLAALAARALPATTAMPGREAIVLASMLAFPVYLGLLIWGFAEPSLARLCLILAAVGIVSWGG
ncbi:MAG TPA: hypothetical protein VFE11_03715, partial [Dongiaceae bacterium]|nr:hypothetical protein [Dongiaceae bacterium]